MLLYYFQVKYFTVKQFCFLFCSLKFHLLLIFVNEDACAFHCGRVVVKIYAKCFGSVASRRVRGGTVHPGPRLVVLEARGQKAACF